jgi:hypothetical protein
MWPVTGRQQVLAAPKMSVCGRRRGHKADGASAGGVQDMAEIVAGRFGLWRLGASWFVVRVGRGCGVDGDALLEWSSVCCEASPVVIKCGSGSSSCERLLVQF